MSRTKIETVTCKVGNQNVTCRLIPGYDFSMCNTKTLKRIGCEVSRPISKKDRDGMFFREMTTTPIGWASISLTFIEKPEKTKTSKKKSRSITTETEVLVVNHEKGMDDEILLGSPWFMGLKVDYKDYLQVFRAKIEVCEYYGSVRTTLNIKSLKGRYHKWVRVPVSISYQELEKNDKYSDSSSESSDSSFHATDFESDSSDSSFYDIDIIKKEILKKLMTTDSMMRLNS